MPGGLIGTFRGTVASTLARPSGGWDTDGIALLLQTPPQLFGTLGYGKTSDLDT